MKKVNCPLCSSVDISKVTSEVRFGLKANVYRCNKCTLSFLDQDSFQYPKDFYEAEYHQTYLTHVEPAAFDPKSYYDKMLKATAPWAERFRALLTGKERVLDVGCSTGHFIELIKDKCAEVYGHDLNVKEVAFARDVLGLKVDNTQLNQRFEEGTFDYITMIYVLEHIADPKSFLAYLRKFLKPGGKMVILVPNIQDPLVNLFDIPEFRTFYYCIEHLYYYNQKTMNDLFAQCGLSGEVQVLQEYPLANHLNWAYTRKPADTLAARRGVPGVDLAPGVPHTDWEQLWRDINEVYKTFLYNHGYGDRLWAVVG